MKIKILFVLSLILLSTGCACMRKKEKADYQAALHRQSQEISDDNKAMAAMHRLIVAWHKKLKAHGINGKES